MLSPFFAADVHARDNQGYSALHRAAMHGRHAVVKVSMVLMLLAVLLQMLLLVLLRLLVLTALPRRSSCYWSEGRTRSPRTIASRWRWSWRRYL